MTALRDISTRKNLEAQRQQSQRLESVGRLAGGIAHDFNNLLTVVMSLVESLLDRPHPADEQDDLKQVLAAAERASDLTQQLLAFARRRIVEPKVVSLNQLVTDTDKMLRRLLIGQAHPRRAAPGSRRKPRDSRNLACGRCRD